MAYETPHFSIENLKAVKAAEDLEASPYFIAKYTQLPNSLPRRVKDLAIHLTKDKSNRYDQYWLSKAISQIIPLYMKQNRLRFQEQIKIM